MKANTKAAKTPIQQSEESKKFVQFAALYPFLETNIVSAKETELKSQHFIEFGDRNQYPNYIWDLYVNVPTLGSIINSIVDYSAGDGIHSENLIWKSDKELTDFARQVFQDLAIYNGCYINVLRSKLGNIARLEVLDYRNVRSDKNNEFFYYSPDFSSEKSYGRCKTTVHPAFSSDKAVESSIYYIKGTSHSTYARPFWSQAVMAAEIEKHIDEFQLNEISNGFVANTMVNFNNGVPNDEIKAEIEEMINEKFTGYENAARPVITFNVDKLHAPTIDRFSNDNFADRYSAAKDRAAQELFTAFRCFPSLVGVPSASGFAQEEFEAAFKLFNKTVIAPIQTKFINAMDDIFEKEDVVQIKPFEIQW